MTNKQLQALIQRAIRQLGKSNKRIREIYLDRGTGRILPRSVALEVAKAQMLLVAMRRAVARPRAVRKAKQVAP